MKNLVIFDWDGVIVDSCPLYFIFYRNTADHFGKIYPLKTLEDFREWYDSTWENNFERLGFSSQEVDMAKEYQLSLVNYEKISLFPEMKKVLGTISKEYDLAIASTTHSSHISEKLRKEGIDSLFSFISGGEGGTSNKKKIIKRTLDEFHVPPDAAVMIGDTLMDITSSKAVHVKSIGVTYGWFSRRRMEEALPDYLIHSPEELPPLLKRIFSL